MIEHIEDRRLLHGARRRCSTVTSSATWPITPRSWLIHTTAVPKSRCRSRTSSMICACVVTSSDVVGSSAISSSGSQAMRDRDHHALPLPARQLVRIGVQPGLRVGQPDRLEQLERTGPRLPAGHDRRCVSRDSVIWRSRVSSGLSDVPGSWNTKPIRPPCTLRSSAVGRADEFECRRTRPQACSCR